MTEEYIKHLEALALPDDNFSTNDTKPAFQYFIAALEKGEDVSQAVEIVYSNFLYYSCRADLAEFVFIHAVLKNDFAPLIRLAKSSQAHLDILYNGFKPLIDKEKYFDQLGPYFLALIDWKVNFYLVYNTELLFRKNLDPQRREAWKQFLVSIPNHYIEKPSLIRYVYLLDKKYKEAVADYIALYAFEEHRKQIHLELSYFPPEAYVCFDEIKTLAEQNFAAGHNEVNNLRFLMRLTLHDKNADQFRNFLFHVNAEGIKEILDQLQNLYKTDRVLFDQLSAVVLEFFESKENEHRLQLVRFLQLLIHSEFQPNQIWRDRILPYIDDHRMTNDIFQLILSYAQKSEQNKNQILALLPNYTAIKGIEVFLEYIKSDSKNNCPLCSKTSFENRWNHSGELPAERTSLLVKLDEVMPGYQMHICKNCRTLYNYSIEERGDGRDRWEEVTLYKVNPIYLKNKNYSYVLRNPDLLEPNRFEKYKSLLFHPHPNTRNEALVMMMSYYLENKKYASIREMIETAYDVDVTYIWNEIRNFDIFVFWNEIYSDDALLEKIQHAKHLIANHCLMIYIQKHLHYNHFSALEKCFSLIKNSKHLFFTHIGQVQIWPEEIKQFMIQKFESWNVLSSIEQITLLEACRGKSLWKSEAIKNKMTTWLSVPEYHLASVKFWTLYANEKEFTADELILEAFVTQYEKTPKDNAIYMSLLQQRALLNANQLVRIIQSSQKANSYDFDYSVNYFNGTVDEFIEAPDFQKAILNYLKTESKNSAYYTLDLIRRAAAVGKDVSFYLKELNSSGINYTKRNEQVEYEIQTLYNYFYNKTEFKNTCDRPYKTGEALLLMNVFYLLLFHQNDVTNYLDYIVKIACGNKINARTKALTNLNKMIQLKYITTEKAEELCRVYHPSESLWAEIKKYTILR